VGTSRLLVFMSISTGSTIMMAVVCCTIDEVVEVVCLMEGQRGEGKEV